MGEWEGREERAGVVQEIGGERGREKTRDGVGVYTLFMIGQELTWVATSGKSRQESQRRGAIE